MVARSVVAYMLELSLFLTMTGGMGALSPLLLHVDHQGPLALAQQIAFPQPGKQGFYIGFRVAFPVPQIEIHLQAAVIGLEILDRHPQDSLSTEPDNPPGPAVVPPWRAAPFL